MIKFGSITDNDIGKNPLNFGHDPDLRPEEILSVSGAQLVGHVATRLPVRARLERSDATELTYSVRPQYLARNVVVPSGISFR